MDGRLVGIQGFSLSMIITITVMILARAFRHLSIGVITVIMNTQMGREKPFLSFVIGPDLLKRLDDFRCEGHFATRAARRSGGC